LPRDDADIARAIAHTLDWNVEIPAGQVQARVEKGWVILEGRVDHDFQRREVERMVRHVRGVIGVKNAVEVIPPVTPDRVAEQIEEAFKREAGIDARRGQVIHLTAPL